MIGKLITALVTIPALAVTPLAGAQIRIGLGGYLYPQYERVQSMLGSPSYALDVGASVAPDSVPQQVDYPGGPINLFRYDKAVAVGVDNLTPALKAAVEESDEPVIVAGVSMGSIVIDHTMTELEDDPDKPAPDEVVFVTYADPQKGLLRLFSDDARIPGYVNQPVPETEYTVINVYSEYDGFSDPPDRPWNLLSTANAAMGAWYLHGTEMYADLDEVPPENISTETNSKGGTTTTYRVPADQLPLTMPLRAVLPHVIVDHIDERLRPKIDKGYSRNDKEGDNRPVLKGGEITRDGEPTNKLPHPLKGKRNKH